MTPLAQARPLGFGELLERGLTLYVRNIVPVSLVLLAVIVPYVIVEYATIHHQIESMMTLLRGGYSFPHIPSVNPVGLAVFIVFAILQILVTPVMFSAIAIGIGRVYEGQPFTFADAYRRAFAHFGALLVASLLALLALIGLAAAAGALIATAVLLTIAAAHAAAGGLAFVAAVLFASLVVLAVIAVMAVVYVAISQGLFAVVLEDLGGGAAMARGFERVLNRKEFWRALLLSLALLALFFVIATVAELLLFLLLSTSMAVAGLFVYSIVLNTVLNGLVLVILTVYYFDLRVRKERDHSPAPL